LYHKIRKKSHGVFLSKLTQIPSSQKIDSLRQILINKLQLKFFDSKLLLNLEEHRIKVKEHYFLNIRTSFKILMLFCA
jgi:hypothetical protein